MRKRAIVVGAGVAGLTAAALLARHDYETTLFEKLDRPGGRAAQASWSGYTFDLGPTLLFMLDVFRDAFAQCGSDFDREVPCTQLRPNYRMHFPNGKTLTVSPVLGETMASLDACSPGAGRGFLAYLAGAARNYDIALREFAGKRFRSTREFVTIANGLSLLRAGAFTTIGRTARRAFGSADAAAAFSFQSMYLGMSPFSSPDLYRLLVFAELGGGVHFPHGGVGALPRALDRVARANGAVLNYGSEVTALETSGANVTGVRVNGQRVEADVVLLSADLPYAYASLLGEPRHRSTTMRHTPSALIVYAALERGYDDLLHHEFLMPADLRQTCRDIFDRGCFPADPAVYLAAPARTDRSMAPPGGEALYLLVPVANLEGSVDWEHATAQLAEETIERVERRRLPGLRSRIAFYKTRTPLDFQRELNLWHGSAFGLSHDLLQIGPLRPDTRHRRYRNLYFAGAGTRPATGLPLVTMSAMQTVDRILEEAADAAA